MNLKILLSIIILLALSGFVYSYDIACTKIDGCVKLELAEFEYNEMDGTATTTVIISANSCEHAVSHVSLSVEIDQPPIDYGVVFNPLMFNIEPFNPPDLDPAPPIKPDFSHIKFECLSSPENPDPCFTEIDGQRMEVFWYTIPWSGGEMPLIQYEIKLGTDSLIGEFTEMDCVSSVPEFTGIGIFLILMTVVIGGFAVTNHYKKK